MAIENAGSITYLGRAVESYRVWSAEDGQWIGLAVELRDGSAVNLAFPHGSLDRLLLEIRQALDLCERRRGGA
ncbi:MAG: hypothetical protein EPO27_10505 [Betaproteobacteria bacterium]|nr:MAG: hypothetical protein EPO27_10505 [Betaproteobacteria bacterium]